MRSGEHPSYASPPGKVLLWPQIVPPGFGLGALLFLAIVVGCVVMAGITMVIASAFGAKEGGLGAGLGVMFVSVCVGSYLVFRYLRRRQTRLAQRFAKVTLTGTKLTIPISKPGVATDQAITIDLAEDFAVVTWSINRGTGSQRVSAMVFELRQARQAVTLSASPRWLYEVLKKNGFAALETKTYLSAPGCRVDGGHFLQIFERVQAAAALR